MSLLSITNHPYKGRCFSLNQNVSAGTLLHVASPASIIPDSESKRRLCASCFQRNYSTNGSAAVLHHSCFSIYSNVEAIPGSRSASLNDVFFSKTPRKSSASIGIDGRVGPPCNHVFYCSVECAERDWLQYHAIECDFLREFFYGNTSSIGWQYQECGQL